MADLGKWLRDPRAAAAAVLVACTATAFVAFAGEPRAAARETREPGAGDRGPGTGEWREAAPIAAPVSPPAFTGPQLPVPGPLFSRADLTSDDPSIRIAAIESAVRVTATEALPDLQRVSLSRDPATAPSIIHAIALLGASAAGPQREEAATTLGRWLRDETKRDALDAPGNVSNLVEALGDLGGPNAVAALAAALDRADLALHVETLAVIKLGELGDAHARAAVERFATRAAALPSADGIDEELRLEALAAAKTTIARL